MTTVKETDVVIAKFDYKATDSQELDIQKGEKLTLMDDTQHWWKVMNSFGHVGYVPSNYVKRSKQVRGIGTYFLRLYLFHNQFLHLKKLQYLLAGERCCLSFFLHLLLMPR